MMLRFLFTTATGLDPVGGGGGGFRGFEPPFLNVIFNYQPVQPNLPQARPCSNIAHVYDNIDRISF